MGEVWLRIIASVVCACLFFVSTMKLQGVLQQGGYKTRTLFKWLKKQGNSYTERLLLLSGGTLLFCAFTVASFAFFGAFIARLISAVPFFFFLLLFCYADGKFALKVPLEKTGRIKRLSVVYFLLLLSINYAVLALFNFLETIIGGAWYLFISYLPFALIVLLLPCILALANLLDSVYENARNKKFIKKAQEKLDNSDVIRIAIMGSYAKTSIKNILRDLLSVKYSVIATPKSYNTPLGIAKTVLSNDFDGKQIFIAEMGARKAGDIEELARFVKPDYAIFTGVCAQHIETFGSEENVLKAKAEILKSDVKKVICGEELREKLRSFDGHEKRVFVDEKTQVSCVKYYADGTAFTLCLDEEKIGVETCLLSAPAVQNITLAALMAKQLGLTGAEIACGVKTVKQIPHRLQLIKENGIVILDDAYNANERSAVAALDALGRFTGRKVVVTPGIVETGTLDKKVNGAFGVAIARSKADDVLLIGETQLQSVKDGYFAAGGTEERLHIFPTLEKAQGWLQENIREGDAVLFLNDLPDVY